MTLMTLFSTRLLATLFFLASLTLFTIGLYQQELINFDTRFFLFAKEMWGSHWRFFPTTYGNPYPDYPATSIIIIDTIAHLFGHLNKFTAVLPSAICAAATVTLTFLIGQRINIIYGCCAALLLICTLTFFKSARSISLDMYITFFTTLCFFCLQRRFSMAYCLLCLFCSFCMRGPIGLVIPTGVMVGFFAVNKEWRAMCKVGMLATLMLIACSATLIYFAYLTGGTVFVHEVLRMQILGRIDNPYLPVYFYFANALATYAISMPFATVTILAFMMDGKKILYRRELLGFLAWLMIVMIGLSIPGDKKVRYILPAAPAMALLAAYPLAIGMAPVVRQLQRALSLFLLIFPALLLTALLATPIIQIFLASEIILQIVMVIIATQIINIIARARATKYATVIFLLVTTINFSVIYLRVIEPIELKVEASRAFVFQIEFMRSKSNANLVFYKENPDGTPIKYMMNMPNWPHSAPPIFIYNNEALAKLSKPYVLLLSQEYRASLPPNFKGIEIGANKIGHVPMIAMLLSN